MLKFNEFIIESKENKNVHLEHLEDEIFNGGVDGTRGAINFLQALRDMLAGHAKSAKVNITTKWDGAPAIFAGINPENGKFFVGTKGVFAQNPKLNYTDADIDKNHPGEGLNAKLKTALAYLPELGIKGIIQGDMMFTKDDLKREKLDGKEYITFQPNTIVYAVPSDSNMAQQILKSKMGVVWHTSYVGTGSLQDMRASFGVDIAGLKPSRNVWYRDASFVDASGTATFTQAETDKLTSILSEAGTLFRKISARTLNQIAMNDTYKTQIKTWNNSKVREGERITNTVTHTQGLILSIEDKLNRAILDAKKGDTIQKRQMEKTIIMGFYKENKEQLKLIFDLMNLLTDAKNMIVKKLQQVKDIGTFMKTDNGYKVTSPEGFVAVDTIKGNAVKLVDRLEFSVQNFNAAKQWSPK